MVAVLAMAVGAVGFVSATLVHDVVLQPDVYSEAFADNDVYRRVYAEVLTDPVVREVSAALLGRFDFGSRDLADRTATTIALARLAVPPNVLRDVAEQIVSNVLAYLRGDVSRLDTEVTLLGALERLDEAAAIVVRNVLADASLHVLHNIDLYEEAVRKFAAELAAGTIPSAVPVAGGSVITESQIIAAINAASQFGLPVSVRDQVMAAVRSDHDRDALIAAAASFTRGHLTALSVELAAGDDLRLDFLDALGTRAGNPQRETVAQLNSIRDAVERFPSWIRYVGLGSIVAGGLILVAANRRRPALALAAAGGGFVVAGLATWLVWRTAANRVDSPLLAAATDDGAGQLPSSVQRIMGDVDASIGRTLGAAVGRQVSSLLAVGVVAVGVAALVVLIPWFLARGRRFAWAATAVTVGGLATGVWLLQDVSPPDRVRECNGHRELCDRRYDEVVQAATHNSMSSPDVVRVWPEHDGNIRAQLDSGIRALLIDSKYWTDVETPVELSSLELPLPADVATDLYRALGSRTEARPGTFLCHSRCAYGAIPFASALVSIREFLDENPDEVVTLIVQDGITPADTEDAFAVSGLVDYVYDGEPEDAWPTLGELIDDGQRLIVFAEQSGPPPGWYRSAFEVINDTSFRVPSPDGFTCDLNRGPDHGSLFLMNHWVQRRAPDRADAVVVNDKDFIVERALACEADRGQLPNFIAVNFFSIGDVVGAVDELNAL